MADDSGLERLLGLDGLLVEVGGGFWTKSKPFSGRSRSNEEQNAQGRDRPAVGGLSVHA